MFEATRLAPIVGAVMLTLVAGCTTGRVDGVGAAAEINASICPPEAKQPITGDTIEVATSGPLSGSYAIIGQSALAIKAYFDMRNDAGGVQTVDGPKKVDVKVYDDQAVPSKTQSAIQEAVEQDHIDATVGLFGGAANMVVAPYLEKNCVAQAWHLTALEAIAHEYPFAATLSTYSDEGQVLAKFLAEREPDAQVAVLVLNDDPGIESLEGFKEQAEELGIEVVAEETYEATDTSVKSQMTTLAASGATVFLNLSVANVCTQAMNGVMQSSWRPTVYFNSLCNEVSLLAAPDAAKGLTVYRSQYLENPHADTPAMQAYRDLMTENGLEVSTTSLLGYNAAMMAEATFTNAAELSRVGIAESANNLPVDPPDGIGYLPYVRLHTKASGAALEAYAVGQWDLSTSSFANNLTEPIPVS
ncbi:ABC transporter substrate-binding protein [Nocardia sp. CA-290969]|uniref:ABC transporter substrate-binding protein n=1 Tax=Nocardia sp. CA-290969 TaxID=3239986 RepID=UPI003D8C686D